MRGPNKARVDIREMYMNIYRFADTVTQRLGAAR